MAAKGLTAGAAVVAATAGEDVVEASVLIVVVSVTSALSVLRATGVAVGFSEAVVIGKGASKKPGSTLVFGLFNSLIHSLQFIMICFGFDYFF